MLWPGLLFLVYTSMHGYYLTVLNLSFNMMQAATRAFELSMWGIKLN